MGKALLNAIFKPATEAVAKWIRNAGLRISMFLLFYPYQFIKDICKPPRGRKRPWLLALLGLSLSSSLCVSYSYVFHSWQVQALKWLYIESRLVQLWPHDTCDWAKYPFKSTWVGALLLSLTSLALTHTIWVKIREHANIISRKGLEHFSEWTTDAIGTHTTSVRIAVNTPLLHIFHDNPESPDLSMYNDGTNTFEALFCERLLNRLSACRRKTRPELRFLYLSPDALRTEADWLPLSDGPIFEGYKNSIEQFRNHLVTACVSGATTDAARAARGHDILCETYKIPLWIAVIRGRDRSDEAATVVLALIDRANLRERPANTASNIDKKHFAKGVADNVLCLKSRDPDIVRFFDNVFAEMWDEETGVRNAILALLRQSGKGKLEVLLRQDYDPVEHKVFRADKPAHVLYTTTEVRRGGGE